MKTSPKTKKNRPIILKNKSWEKQFHALEKYKKKFGNCYMSNTRNDKRYKALAAWCSIQRSKRNEDPSKFNPIWLHKLNKLGFCWDVRDEIFEYNIQLLKAYKKKYGDCNVKKSINWKLAIWCYDLRYRYNSKSHPLTKERVEILDKMGFVWDAGSSFHWEKQFAELMKFKIKHGHCDVRMPNKKTADRRLAEWVYIQRRRYRSKSKILTPEKFEKLNSIGFFWVPPALKQKRRIKDDDLLDELRRLFKERGSVPNTTVINKYGKYSASVYNTHFGGLGKACKVAGIIG